MVNVRKLTEFCPFLGMLVAKIGGPVYRIGVGGGAASSVTVQGDQEAELDFGAVQRGDAEMEQKLHRLVRACVERGACQNPILSIHDQGAGGNGALGQVDFAYDVAVLGGAARHCAALTSCNVALQ